MLYVNYISIKNKYIKWRKEKELFSGMCYIFSRKITPCPVLLEVQTLHGQMRGGLGSKSTHE